MVYVDNSKIIFMLMLLLLFFLPNSKRHLQATVNWNYFIVIKKIMYGDGFSVCHLVYLNHNQLLPIIRHLNYDINPSCEMYCLHYKISSLF